MYEGILKNLQAVCVSSCRMLCLQSQGIEAAHENVEAVQGGSQVCFERELSVEQRDIGPYFHK